MSIVQEAIHSPSDDAETLKRTNVCLALYFQADEDADTKLGIRQAFVSALESFPAWAMHAAFDRWERTGARRPSPGEIAILASREVAPLYAEIKRRQAETEARQAPAPNPVTAEAAARILHSAGFTPRRMDAIRSAPMAATFAEAESRTDAPARPHWSETADPEGPEWAALRASRANNALIRKASGEVPE